MNVKLWFIKYTYFALITRCPRCKGTNRNLNVIESNKGKRKIVCDECLVDFPIAGLTDKNGGK